MCALLSAVILFGLTSSASAQTPTDSVPSVVVQRVTERDVAPQFKYIGRVEAIETVDLRARVDGILEEQNFQDGADVLRGDLLFVIERAPYEVVVQQRDAELAATRASLVNAEADFERKSTLVERGNIPQASVDLSRAQLGIAKADVLKAQAFLRQAQLDLGYTEIRSPITGQISQSTYSVGNLVGASSDPLATVLSMDPIHVTMAISEKQLLDARKQGIDMDNPPVEPFLILSDGSEYSFRGEFDYLAPQVDRSTDTVIGRAVFPNPRRILVPGQFVQVTVRHKRREPGLTVSQAAVQQDSRGYFVLVVDRENKVEVRRVQVGPQIDANWVIEQGLASDERVIIRGLQKVRPNEQVNPVEQAEG
ncbi:MAG: efflux RND transporter periplasmic adaptor subunit [Alphaproteobacteria bacterium]|nr:efflux RND transporter periplasmic adaptor subunit [Alphaproteobacteria bacterium]